MTPLELASAYAAIAADGAFVAPTVIERIRDAGGREILSPRTGAPGGGRSRGRGPGPLDARGGRGRRHGTAAALPGWPVLGKTGTSQDRADAWFVGAVPSLAAAVSVGDPMARTAMPEATGGTVAAPIWRSLMASVLAGRRPGAFPPLRPAADPRGLSVPEPEPDRRGGR